MTTSNVTFTASVERYSSSIVTITGHDNGDVRISTTAGDFTIATSRSHDALESAIDYARRRVIFNAYPMTVRDNDGDVVSHVGFVNLIGSVTGSVEMLRIDASQESRSDSIVFAGDDRIAFLNAIEAAALSAHAKPAKFSITGNIEVYAEDGNMMLRFESMPGLAIPVGNPLSRNETERRSVREFATTVGKEPMWRGRRALAINRNPRTGYYDHEINISNDQQSLQVTKWSYHRGTWVDLFTVSTSPEDLQGLQRRATQLLNSMAPREPDGDDEDRVAEVETTRARAIRAAVEVALPGTYVGDTEIVHYDAILTAFVNEMREYNIGYAPPNFRDDLSEIRARAERLIDAL